MRLTKILGMTLCVFTLSACDLEEGAGEYEEDGDEDED